MPDSPIRKALIEIDKKQVTIAKRSQDLETEITDLNDASESLSRARKALEELLGVLNE